jgi:hypothetical protein
VNEGIQPSRTNPAKSVLCSVLAGWQVLADSINCGHTLVRWAVCYPKKKFFFKVRAGVIAASSPASNNPGMPAKSVSFGHENVKSV